MRDTTFQVDPEDLAAHTDRLRGLVRTLVSDPGRVDDIVQETQLVALTQPRRQEIPLRAWLVGIARDLVRRDRRSASRRADREAAAARSTVSSESASPHELVERADLLRVVVEELVAMDEPHRGVLLLRYVDGLEPHEIAARTGTPGGTVRSRLLRGLELLRQRLDTRHGGRRSQWHALCLPLLTTETARAPLAAGEAAAVGTGGLLMTATAKLVGASAVLALVAGLGFLAWQEGADGDAPQTSGQPVAAATDAALSRRHVSGDARAQAPDVARSAESTDPAPDERSRVAGRVLLPDGSPATGVAVTLAPPHGREWITTDPAGRFDLEDALPGEAARVWVLAPGYRTSPIEALLSRAGEAARVPDIQLTPGSSVRLSGVVSSSADLPIRGARVSVTWSAPQAEIDAAPTALDPTIAAMLLATRDDPAVAPLRSLGADVAADGGFSFEFPAGVGAVGLRATAEGHLHGYLEPARPATLSQRPITISMLPLPRARGRVLDGASGLPIPGARVGFHWVYSRRDVTWRTPPSETDAAGRFDVVGVPDGGTHLLVDATGYPVWWDEPGADEELRIEVQRRLTIEGVVVREDATPVVGATVRTRARIRSGDGQRSVQTDAEGKFTLADIPDDPHPVHVAPPAGENLRPRLIEDVPAGTADLRVVIEPGLVISGVIVGEDGRPVPQAYVSAARTDGTPLSGSTPSGWGASGRRTAEGGPDGSFRVAGLDPGTYRLSAQVAPDAEISRVPARVDDVVAGATGVRVTLRRGASISGVVVDEDGRPMVGRAVHALDPRLSPLVGDHRGPSATTDAEGRFALGGVEVGGTYWLRAQWPYGEPDQRTWLAGGESVRAGSTDLRLVLVDGGSVAGMVVDEDGQPIPRELVWIVRATDNSTMRGGYLTYTDDAGRFEILHIPPLDVLSVVCHGGRSDEIALGTDDVRLVKHAK